MFYVVYGSQTGNSEAIAKRISFELKNLHKIENEFLVMNNFLSRIQKFPEKIENINFVILFVPLQEMVIFLVMQKIS